MTRHKKLIGRQVDWEGDEYKEFIFYDHSASMLCVRKSSKSNVIYVRFYGLITADQREARKTA